MTAIVHHTSRLTLSKGTCFVAGNASGNTRVRQAWGVLVWGIVKARKADFRVSSYDPDAEWRVFGFDLT